MQQYKSQQHHQVGLNKINEGKSSQWAVAWSFFTRGLMCDRLIDLL